MRTTRSQAFTLVELLVVIAIIGILIALIMPGVQATREIARRAECQNNLTQLISATHKYESAHEVYPSGVLGDKGPILSEPKGFHHGWIISLLPYIDENVIYKHIDEKESVYAAKNAEVRKMQIQMLLCPTDSFDPLPVGVSNYAGVHHDVEAPINSDNRGVLFLNSKLRREDISDGTSHTIFIGEKLCGPGDLGWMSGTRATLRNTGAGLNAELLYQAKGQVFVPDKAGKGTVPADGDPMAPMGHFVTPPPDPPLHVGGFDSRHTNGVNFAFGDGSVRWIPDTIQQHILEQLANRADGKLMKEDY